jgi:hypothetical protein
MESSTQTATELLTVDAIQTLLGKIQYKDWKFIVHHKDVWENGGWDVMYLIRAEWMAPDNVTGVVEKQQSRWWVISKHATKTEIVNTAFLCMRVAEEHEFREGFKYKAEGLVGDTLTTPYNTHVDIDVLGRASEQVDVRIDTRPEAPKNQRRE